METGNLDIRMLIIHSGLCGTRLADREDSGCAARCARADITSFICENLDSLGIDELEAITEMEPGHVYTISGGAFTSHHIEMVEGEDAITEYKNMVSVYDEVRHFNGQKVNRPSTQREWKLE